MFHNSKVKSWILSAVMLKGYLEICFQVELVIATKAAVVAAMSAVAVCAKKRCVKVRKKTPTATITQIVTMVYTAESLSNGHSQRNVQL